MQNVAAAQTSEEATRLSTARRVAFSALARVSPTTILEDATVPRNELANMIRFEYAVKLGGTITGEHGVGLAKKAFLPKTIGDASLGLMRRLKRTLDPDNLLNPGKIFD